MHVFHEREALVLIWKGMHTYILFEEDVSFVT